jgi:hypothetical protein
MDSSSQAESTLNQLQSQAQVELLDAVDRLRLNGFQGELGKMIGKNANQEPLPQY